MEGGDVSVAYIQQSLAKLQLEVKQIIKRNIAKDHGKEFEGSYTRVIFLMCITYCTLYGYMSLIGTHNAALNAIVPTIGFNISTWSLPFVKNLWIYFKENTGGLERTGDATTYGTSDDIDV